MIELTILEHAILQEFSQRDWSTPDREEKAVDHLACRGLLVRKGRVEVPLKKLSSSDTVMWDYEKAERSTKHSYHISKRGLKALNGKGRILD